MATRLNPTNFGYQNFYSAVLTADMTSVVLTASLDTVPTPSSGILVIDPDSSTSREVVLYTSKGASTVTFPSDGRGYSGSTAAAHLTGTTVIMAPIDKWFSALASGELSTDPLRTELFSDYVASGAVWSGDSYAGSRNASMTSGVIYIAGRRLTLAAVTARSFTASTDTYIDASDATSDGVATLTYTEVANNAASPALAANRVRIGIIQTGATNIASAGAVNQGQFDKALPIASSIPYTKADSLGNIICNRTPIPHVIGYRLFGTTGSITAETTPTGASIVVSVPANRSITIVAYIRASGTTGDSAGMKVKVDGVQLKEHSQTFSSTGIGTSYSIEVGNSPTAGTHTVTVTMARVSGAGGVITVEEGLIIVKLD